MSEIITSFRNNNLLTENYHAIIDAYYDTHWKSFSSRYHAHKHIELMYVSKGACEIILNDTKVKFKKYDYVLIDSNTFHQLVVGESGCHIINLEFHFEPSMHNYPSLSTYLKHSKNINLLFGADKNYLVLKDMEEISHILYGILHCQRNGADKELLLQLMMTELLLKISSNINSSDKKNYGSYVYIKKVISFLETNYDSNLRIKEIAEYVNLHPSYLQKIFHANMNCTVFEYLTNLRLEKSKILLTTTDMLITDIPCYIGMNSVQYYINLFHKKNNCTPLQYRRKHSALYRTDDYDNSFLLK